MDVDPKIVYFSKVAETQPIVEMATLLQQLSIDHKRLCQVDLKPPVKQQIEISARLSGMTGFAGAVADLLERPSCRSSFAGAL